MLTHLIGPVYLRVNPSWRAKDSPSLQAKFYRWSNPTKQDNLMCGYTRRVWKQKVDLDRLLTQPGVFAREKVNPLPDPGCLVNTTKKKEEVCEC